MAELIRAAGKPSVARRLPGRAAAHREAEPTDLSVAPIAPEPPPVCYSETFVQELQARIAELEADLEQRREAAEVEARAKGFDAGEREGLQRFEESLQRTEKLAASCEQARMDWLRASEDDLVEIVVAALGKMLGDALADAAGARGAVVQAIQRVGNIGAIKVHVAPRDLELLAPVVEAVRGEGRVLQLVGDTRVQLGGCLIETDSGTLDARIESQFGLLREALIDVRERRK